MISEQPANVNALWADLVMEEMARLGVDCVCLSSGSRSTPLVSAVAARPEINKIVHYDERGTAFFALGYGLATGRSAMWLTTSGTAVANGLPAVVEAAQSYVPLLLVTADRPPELREVGANQAIRQVSLFGDYVRWQFDLPCPTPDIAGRMVLTTVDQAVYRAHRAPRGPVHLNCMFREPLAGISDGGDYFPYLEALGGWLTNGRPLSPHGGTQPALDGGVVESVLAVLEKARNPLLIVGRLNGREEMEAAARLARTLGMPVCPDVTSGLRLGLSSPHSIPYYDQMLTSRKAAAALGPDAVLHIGGPITSKRLLTYLQATRPPDYIQVRPYPSRQDPLHRVTLNLECHLVAFCRALSEMNPNTPGAEDWTASWRAANGRVEEVLEGIWRDGQCVSEPWVARHLSEALPDDHGLFLGNSMPVRDMDAYGAASGATRVVAANRGASGVDGTVASAAGFAYGLEKPVTLLIGDVALLHDLNSLSLLRSRRSRVVVVVLNNNGGGIFHFLPVAAQTDIFETYFGTPHNLGFESAAALYGLHYVRAETCDAFVSAYREAIEADDSAIIEIPSDRRRNVEVHGEIQAAVARALDG